MAEEVQEHEEDKAALDLTEWFAFAVREARARLGMSQSALAEKMDVAGPRQQAGTGQVPSRLAASASLIRLLELDANQILEPSPRVRKQSRKPRS